MRPIEELLEFLTGKMSMQTIYQPAIILYLLTQGGVASRAVLARVLSGYDDRDLAFWDKVLMDNPKRSLVGKHQILNYDKNSQMFSLPFDRSNHAGVEQAKAICKQKIETWIQKEATNKKLSDDDLLWLCRVLELAHRADHHHLPESSLHLDEFAISIILDKLHQRYPGYKITQQPYSQVGFDILVGTPNQPIAYVKVKATEALEPTIYLSEGEREFSIEQSELYILGLVYAINLSQSTYQILLHQGAIQVGAFTLVPLQWKATWLPASLG